MISQVRLALPQVVIPPRLLNPSEIRLNSVNIRQQTLTNSFHKPLSLHTNPSSYTIQCNSSLASQATPPCQLLPADLHDADSPQSAITSELADSVSTSSGDRKRCNDVSSEVPVMCGFGSLSLPPNTSLQSSLNLSTSFNGGDSAVPPISPVCAADDTCSASLSQASCIFPSSVTYRSSPLRPPGTKWPSSSTYTLETIPADQLAVATQVELTAPAAITSPVISATAPSLSPSRHTGRCTAGGVTRATSLLGVLAGRNNSSHALPVLAINTSVVQRIGPLLKRSRVSSRNVDTLYCPPRSLLVRPRPKARSSVPSRPRRAFAANNVQPSASITSSPAVATVALSVAAQTQSNQICSGLDEGAESSSPLSEAVRSQKPLEFDPDAVPSSPRLNSLHDSHISQLSASESSAPLAAQHPEIVTNTTKQISRPSLRSTRRLASPTAAMRTIRQLMASSRRSPVSAPRIAKRNVNTAHSPVAENAKESAYFSKAFGFAKQFSSRWSPQSNSQRKAAPVNEPCVPLQLYQPPPPFSSPSYVFKPHALMEHDYTRHVFGYFLQAQATSSPALGTCALSLPANVVVPASLIPRVMHDTAAPAARDDALRASGAPPRSPHQRLPSTASDASAACANARSPSPSKAKRARRSPNCVERTSSSSSPKALRSPRAHNTSVTSQPASPHKQRRFIFDAESDSEEDLPLDKLLERVASSSQQEHPKGVKRGRRKELATVNSPLKRLRAGKKADSGSGNGNGKLANVTARMENEVLRLLEQQERSRLGSRAKLSDQFVYYGVPGSTSTSPAIQQHSPKAPLGLQAADLDLLEPATNGIGASSSGGAQNLRSTRAALRARGQAAAEPGADPNKSSEWMPGIDPAYFEFKSRKTGVLPPLPPPMPMPMSMLNAMGVPELGSVTTLSQSKIALLTSPGAGHEAMAMGAMDVLADPLAELDTKHVIDAILQAEAMAKASDPLAGLGSLGGGGGGGGSGSTKSMHDLQHDVDNKPLELSGLDSGVVPMPLCDAHDLLISDVVGLHLCPSVGVPDCILGMLASGEVQSAAALLPNVTSASPPPSLSSLPHVADSSNLNRFPSSPLPLPTHSVDSALPLLDASLNEHNISTFSVSDALSLSSLFTPTSPPTSALAFLPHPQQTSTYLMLGDMITSITASNAALEAARARGRELEAELKTFTEPVEASMTRPQLDYSLSSTSSGAFSCATSETQQQHSVDLKLTLCNTLPTPAQTPTSSSIGEALGFPLPLSASHEHEDEHELLGFSLLDAAHAPKVLLPAGGLMGCSATSVESGVASAVSRGASQSGASTSDACSSAPASDAHVFRTPELTTVNMFWNDLPALLIDRREYIRLVDLHRQVLLDKPPSTLKSRCGTLGIEVRLCTDHERDFLVRYAHAAPSRNKWIVSREGARQLIMWYVNPTALKALAASAGVVLDASELVSEHQAHHQQHATASRRGRKARPTAATAGASTRGGGGGVRAGARRGGGGGGLVAGRHKAASGKPNAPPIAVRSGSSSSTRGGRPRRGARAGKSRQ